MQTRASLEQTGVAAAECLEHGLLHLIHAEPQLGSDLFVGHAIQLRKQKDLPDAWRQTLQQCVDFGEGFDQQVALLGR